MSGRKYTLKELVFKELLPPHGNPLVKEWEKKVVLKFSSCFLRKRELELYKGYRYIEPDKRKAFEVNYQHTMERGSEEFVK